MFKSYFSFLIVLICLAIPMSSYAAPLKPRMVVLTDISPNNVEPDDMESIIRLFAHADMFEIECLVHSTGWSVWGDAGDTGLNLIKEVIDLYEKDLPNLMKRSNQVGHLHDDEHQRIGYWPSADYLRKRTMLGSKNRGQKFIGVNNNSEGSKAIIALVDEADDDRPIWVTVWGGGNTLAQSCWQVQQDRTNAELKTFLHKLRVYTITDQDAAQKRGNVVNWPESSHQWMRKAFEKDLLFIWDESAWLYQNGTGRRRWNDYETHVQNHGHMGKRYPKYKYGVEGDTPAFLHLMPNGLNNPNVPNQVGWGGYFEFGQCKDNTTSAYQNHGGKVKKISSKYQQYFYQATFNNFAARMDWAKDGHGNRNPMIVINGNDDIDIMRLKPKQGKKVILDASKTSDPDDDKLTFKWWMLSEAGTYADDVTISNNNSSIATVNVPSDSAGKSFHVICEVTDNGTHNLTSYRRVIFEPGLTGDKPRVIATTDGEIDDECSMVRFLLYANEWDIEGIVTSSSQYHWQGHRWAGDDWVEPYLDAYAQVYSKLAKHDPAFPTPEYLRKRTVLGNVKAEGEMEEVTAGSQLIVKVLLDDTDDRPIWLQAWGGPNTIARALKTIEEKHPERMAEVAKKLRFFFIWEQDSTYQNYIRPHWGKYNIPTIISDQFIAIAYNWKKIIPREKHPFFDGLWMKKHILENHGPLCALYKAHKEGDKGFEDGDFRSEGDSPAFLHTIPTGLRSMESPDWGGWGGRFERVRENTWLDPVLESGYQYPEGRWYMSNAWGRNRMRENIPNDEELVVYLKPMWRWFEAIQNDFAARADWCVKPYEQANHAPIVKLAHVRNMKARPGDKVSLSAKGTTDPDGDTLTYRWWQYQQADTYDGTIEIKNTDHQEVVLTIPNDAIDGKTIHIICEVADDGTPPLTRYRRIVITIKR